MCDFVRLASLSLFSAFSHKEFISQQSENWKMKMKKISPKVSKIKRGDIRIYVNIKRANTHTHKEREENIKREQETIWLYLSRVAGSQKRI